MNFTILKNFTTDWILPAAEEFKKFENYFVELAKNADFGDTFLDNNIFLPVFHKHSKNLYHLIVDKNKLNCPYSNILRNLSKKDWHITLYVSLPGRQDPFHVDSSRSSAINFPIFVNKDLSYFKIGKETDLNTYKKIGEHHREWQKQYFDNGAKGHYDLTEEEYETYNLEYPVAFNCKIPHGGVNMSTSTRVIGSITFKETTYKELIQKIPGDWL